jgi:hypothetical protein
VKVVVTLARSTSKIDAPGLARHFRQLIAATSAIVGTATPAVLHRALPAFEVDRPLLQSIAWIAVFGAVAVSLSASLIAARHRKCDKLLWLGGGLLTTAVLVAFLYLSVLKITVQAAEVISMAPLSTAAGEYVTSSVAQLRNEANPLKAKRLANDIQETLELPRSDRKQVLKTALVFPLDNLLILLYALSVAAFESGLVFVAASCWPITPAAIPGP